jgi:ketosteroid isomerase-like protein
MTENKNTVTRYVDGFNKLDHKRILDCLTDDIEWVIPGMFHITGKAAFDGEIENEAFEGAPVIETLRLTEENDVVVAEGTVRTGRLKNGTHMNLVFCDVFEMRDGRIRKLTSYLSQLK